MSKRIQGITIVLDGDTTGLDKALKSVETESNKVQRELRDVEKLLKMDPGNTELIAQKQKLLGDQVEITESKLKQLKAAQEQVEAEFKSGNIGEEQYRAFQREIAETESKLKSYKTQLAGVSPEQEKLATNTNRLKTYFAATKSSIDDYSGVLGTKLTAAIKNGTASSDQLELALNKIGKEAVGSKGDLTQFKQVLDKVDDGASLEKIDNDLKQIRTDADSAGTAMGEIGKKIDAGNMMEVAQYAAQAGQAVVDFGQKSMDAFITYDDGVDTIIKKTGAHGDAISEFQDIYDDLVNTIAVTDPYSSAGEAIGELNTQFGLTGDTLKDASANFMKFAEINEVDMTSSVQSAEQVISSFGLTADSLPWILDSVTVAAQKTGVGADTLMESMVNGAGALREMGLDAQQSAMFMGLVEQAGVDSSAAVSQLSKAQGNWAKEGKSMSQGLSELQAKLQGSGDKTEALATLTEVFGTKGAEKIRKLVESGTLDLSTLAGSYEDVSGAVQQTYDDITGADEKWKLAQDQVNNAMADFGGIIMEALLPALQILADIIKSVADFFGSLPGPIQQIIVVFGALAAVAAILAPGIIALAVANTALDVALLPIIGIVLAVIAVIALIVTAITNWEAITNWFSEGWTNIFNALPEPVQGALTTVQTVGSEAMGAISAMMTGDTQAMTDHLVNIYNALPEPVQNALVTMGSLMEGAQKSIDAFMQGDTQGLRDGLVQIYNSLPAPVQNALTTMGNALKGAMDWINQSMIQPFNQKIQSISDKFWEIVNSVQGAIDSIRGIMSGEIPFPHISMPHFNISGGFSLNPPRVPSFNVDWYAKGGVLTKPTIFGNNGANLMGGGEAGPEAVAPVAVLKEYVRDAVETALSDKLDKLAEIMMAYLPVIAEKDTDIILDGESMVDKIYPTLDKKIYRNTQNKKLAGGLT